MCQNINSKFNRANWKFFISILSHYNYKQPRKLTFTDITWYNRECYQCIICGKVILHKCILEFKESTAKEYVIY